MRTSHQTLNFYSQRWWEKLDVSGGTKLCKSLEQNQDKHQTVILEEAAERHFQVKKQLTLRKASVNDYDHTLHSV